MEIYRVGAGAAINQTARFANVTMAPSDDPQGVVYFPEGHRLPVATATTTKLSLQVHRRASAASAVSVQYRTLVRSACVGSCGCGEAFGVVGNLSLRSFLTIILVK